ncbi:hypothetical protein [Portibacter lacus]|nr:hypothetical protein [Portibacter lacus]
MLYPVKYEVREYDTAFSKYVFGEILSSPLMQSFVACILVFLIANFINRHIIQNRISKFLTLLPGLFFVLITSGMPGGLMCSPAMFSAFFLVLALISINKIYKVDNAAIYIFNAGFYIAIASIFYSASISFWAFGVISMLILRSFKISELFILTSGVFVPLFLLGSYYYWHGELILIQSYFQFDKGILAVFQSLNLQSILYLAVIGITILYAIVRYNTFTMKIAIQVQKKVDIIYWFMMFSLIMMFFINGVSITHLVILSVPFAMFIGLSYEKMKSSMIAEVLHIGIIVAILLAQFNGWI